MVSVHAGQRRRPDRVVADDHQDERQHQPAVHGLPVLASGLQRPRAGPRRVHDRRLLQRGPGHRHVAGVPVVCRARPALHHPLSQGQDADAGGRRGRHVGHLRHSDGDRGGGADHKDGGGRDSHHAKRALHDRHGRRVRDGGDHSSQRNPVSAAWHFVLLHSAVDVCVSDCVFLVQHARRDVGDT